MATDSQSAMGIILVTNTRKGIYGGYKLGLLDRKLSNLEKKLILCTACSGILRDPISVESKLKCRSCLEHNESGEPSVSASIGITDSLKVSCPFKDEGCGWCDSITNIIDHKNHCQHFLDKYPNCPEIDVACSFKRYGCEVVTKRKHMEHHEKESQTSHLKMMDKHIKSTDENLKNLQSEFQILNSKLQLVETEMKHTFGGIICEIPGVREKMKISRSYKTNEFYVGLYSFQATIYPRHDDKENLGIYIQTVRGQFDDKLVWPIRGKISFTLMNQMNETNSITNAFTITTDNQDSFQRYSINSRGFPILATHQTLLKDEFSKSDTIKIKIMVQLDAPPSKIE